MVIVLDIGETKVISHLLGIDYWNYELHTRVSLHTASAPVLYCPEFNVSSGKASKPGNIFHGAEYLRKEIYNSKKAAQIERSETFETFFVSKLLIWRRERFIRVRPLDSSSSRVAMK